MAVLRPLAPALLVAAASACGGGPAGAGTPPPQPPAAIAEYLSAHDAVRAGASPAPVPPLSPLSGSSAACVLHTCSGGAPPPGWTGSWEYLVCDYVPPGNVSGQRPY